MKNVKLLSLTLIIVLLSGCTRTKNEGEKSLAKYEEHGVTVYRKKDSTDSLTLRFYEDSPHVPYISVTKFYREFFSRGLIAEPKDSVYKYLTGASYLEFDITNQTMSILGISAFNYHPYYKVNSGQGYMTYLSGSTGTPTVRTIDFKQYQMKIYADGNNVYVPLTLLSNMSGGGSGYNISYNGKDIYVLDYNGILFEEATPHTYFGKEYTNNLFDFTTSRDEDMAKYNYYQLCLTFDNFRGETKQLYLGDENLRTLGLDKALTTYYPHTKELLLSLDKEEYLLGYTYLMQELYDGGHTVNTTALPDIDTSILSEDIKEEVKSASEAYTSSRANRKNIVNNLFDKRRETFNLGENEAEQYYRFDNSTKTAYIGFDSFDYDYKGWDNFYKGTGEIPVETDTYAFVRDKLLKANGDGAENVIFDLSINGGGSVASLIGLEGLVNHDLAYYNVFETVNRFEQLAQYRIDLDLDGKISDDDITFADSFNFQYAVLTTSTSFSCGNLMPCLFQNLGIPILGEKSGGGSCNVARAVTADGLCFVMSSYNTILDLNKQNVDGGAPVDLSIDVENEIDNYFNFEFVANYLNGR